jgi:hypothetical protein
MVIVFKCHKNKRNEKEKVSQQSRQQTCSVVSVSPAPISVLSSWYRRPEPNQNWSGVQSISPVPIPIRDGLSLLFSTFRMIMGPLTADSFF